MCEEGQYYCDKETSSNGKHNESGKQALNTRRGTCGGQEGWGGRMAYHNLPLHGDREEDDKVEDQDGPEHRNVKH